MTKSKVTTLNIQQRWRTIEQDYNCPTFLVSICLLFVNNRNQGKQLFFFFIDSLPYTVYNSAREINSQNYILIPIHSYSIMIYYMYNGYRNIFIYNEELPYLLFNSWMIYTDCPTFYLQGFYYFLLIILSQLLFTMTLTFCLQWHCLVVCRPVTMSVVTDLRRSWCLRLPACSDDRPTSQSPPDSTLRASIHQVINNSVVNRQISPSS